MKLVFAVFCVWLGALVEGLSNEHLEKIYQNKDDCVESTGANKDIVENAFRHGIFAEDDKLKEFYFCFLHKNGFVDENGSYQFDALRAHMIPEFNKELVESIVECASEDQGSGPENAIQLSKCFHEKIPKEWFLD